MKKNYLAVSDIFYSYQKSPILKGTSFSVESGQIVSLLGPNGSGKTTSFYVAAGFVAPDSGDVFWNEEKITFKPLFQRAQMGLGYLPQEPCLFKDLKVYQQVDMILQLSEKKAISAKRDELISMFRLRGCANKFGYMLSGGERRRLEVLCALACEPKIVLMDEPFAGVDPKSISEMKDLIFMLKEKGIGVLVTDHNIKVALGICDYNYIIHEGKVEIQGTSDFIKSSKKAREFYLGNFLEE